MKDAPRGAFRNTFDLIKLPFVFKIFALSIFEWSFYTALLYLIVLEERNECLFKQLDFALKMHKKLTFIAKMARMLNVLFLCQ